MEILGCSLTLVLGATRIAAGAFAILKSCGEVKQHV